MSNQIITVKLKLDHTPDQLLAINTLCLAYRDALNYASMVAFNHNKTANKLTIHKLVYENIRTKFNIGSQLACSISRDVGAKYKQQWTKLKQHQENLKKGYTKKRYKGLDNPVKFSSRSVTLQHKKDYTFNLDKGTVSIPTLSGRIKLKFYGWDKHVALLKTSTLGAATLYYQKSKKQYFLCVSVEVTTPDIELKNLNKVIGVDLGQRYLASTQSNDNKVRFYSGRFVKHKSNQFSLKRSELQAKGTRSAIRKLVSMSGRERRFKLNVNHTLSKNILTDKCIIGLEDLKHIRTRMKRRRGKNASKKQRTANSNYSKWAFAELGTFLEYKAKMGGSLVIKVDAEYTSQGCPKCGHTSPNNRPKKGLLFKCECCSYSDHADRVGAINVLMRTTLVRQSLISGGSLSACLNASGYEAKAERLKCFSELRWSPETSSAL